ncbi:MAG TPA: DUF1045 domain-containing protein [Devosia sp.]|nr:DUF1045 domain-containing protein [Devosia sp.]
MPERLAIYYAPARHSPLDILAARWLARPELAALTVSARRYGFHATIKAPMALKPGKKPQELAADLKSWCAKEAPVSVGRIEARLIDGFLALVPAAQSEELTNFAGRVVETFDPFRAPLDAKERAKRLSAPLTDRQIKLVDRYGYPYVMEQFLFHMTLTDRLPPAQSGKLLAEARTFFAEALALPLVIDRLVLFHERQSGAMFTRGADFTLAGGV